VAASLNQPIEAHTKAHLKHPDRVCERFRIDVRGGLVVAKILSQVEAVALAGPSLLVKNATAEGRSNGTPGQM
jgi:hypothetical protein